MDDQPIRGRPPGAEQRRKTQLRLYDWERDELRRCAKRVKRIRKSYDPKAGYTTWLRDLGLLVAEGGLPNRVHDWLHHHDLVPKRRAA